MGRTLIATMDSAADELTRKAVSCGMTTKEEGDKVLKERSKQRDKWVVAELTLYGISFAVLLVFLIFILNES